MGKTVIQTEIDEVPEDAGYLDAVGENCSGVAAMYIREPMVRK